MKARVSPFAAVKDKVTRPTIAELDQSASPKYRSREPMPAPAAPVMPKPMTYRSGRDTAMSVRITAESRASFYAVAIKNGWKAGEALERAIALLVAEDEREP